MDFTKHKESNVGSKSEGRQWVEHCINLYVDLCKENRLESRSGLCTELLADFRIPKPPGCSQGAPVFCAVRVADFPAEATAVIVLARRSAVPQKSSLGLAASTPMSQPSGCLSPIQTTRKTSSSFERLFVRVRALPIFTGECMRSSAPNRLTTTASAACVAATVPICAGLLGFGLHRQISFPRVDSSSVILRAHDGPAVQLVFHQPQAGRNLPDSAFVVRTQQFRFQHRAQCCVVIAMVRQGPGFNERPEIVPESARHSI